MSAPTTHRKKILLKVIILGDSKSAHLPHPPSRPANRFSVAQSILAVCCVL